MKKFTIASIALLILTSFTSFSFAQTFERHVVVSRSQAPAAVAACVQLTPVTTMETRQVQKWVLQTETIQVPVTRWTAAPVQAAPAAITPAATAQACAMSASACASDSARAPGRIRSLIKALLGRFMPHRFGASACQ